jgi:hypothetical protein
VIGARRFCALIVLGTSLVGAVWLYTYRVASVVDYIEYIGPYRHHYHPSQQVNEQPWWGVPATVALIAIGAAITMWLLPQWRRPIRRFTNSQPSNESRVGGQYVSTAGPMRLERGTAPHRRESHDPPRLSPNMK